MTNVKDITDVKEVSDVKKDIDVKEATETSLALVKKNEDSLQEVNKKISYMRYWKNKCEPEPNAVDWGFVLVHQSSVALPILPLVSSLAVGHFIIAPVAAIAYAFLLYAPIYSKDEHPLQVRKYRELKAVVVNATTAMADKFESAVPTIEKKSLEMKDKIVSVASPVLKGQIIKAEEYVAHKLLSHADELKKKK